MAMHIPKAPGFAQMLKDGAQHFSGLDEAVYRNIEAGKELARSLRTTYGPNGLNKMVINHIGKLFVTNDAATIIRELEVQHPAAKMLVLASQQQEAEAGDGTNFVVVYGGALLEHAMDLLRMGLSTTEVIYGFETALEKAQEILPTLTCGSVSDLTNKDQIFKTIKSAVMSKQYGNEEFLANLIIQACVTVVPSNQKTFNVDNVRVCKIPGCGVLDSSVVKGMVFKREVEGVLNRAQKAKVAVYSCPLDAMQTETKGTVIIKSAAELENFSKGEESQIEEQIKSIAAAGCKVVVSGGKVGELALHYCNKYQIMVVRLMSKWDLRRLCKTIRATALPRVTPPTPEEAGYCDNVYVDEIGDTPVIVFDQAEERSSIATIVIRGSTDNIMDDIERAVDDGVNTFKGLTKDNRLVPGAGATEMELAKQIYSYGETMSGLEQYGIKKFAEALESLPKALAENSGLKATDIISNLTAAHQSGNKLAGVNLEDDESEGGSEPSIVDLYLTKYWALRFATNAACTILRVDQIIMAKPAGGPKPKENKDWDED